MFPTATFEVQIFPPKQCWNAHKQRTPSKKVQSKYVGWFGWVGTVMPTGQHFQNTFFHFEFVVFANIQGPAFSALWTPRRCVCSSLLRDNVELMHTHGDNKSKYRGLFIYIVRSCCRQYKQKFVNVFLRILFNVCIDSLMFGSYSLK